VLRLEREANALKTLALNLGPLEARDYLKRSHMAHDVLNHFDQDLTNKYKFYKSLKEEQIMPLKTQVNYFKN
jgi:hypothetical protein